MKFSETIKRADTTLVISRRHEAWVEDADRKAYTPQALRFAQVQLGKQDRERKGTVSASSLGDCPRAQQFTFLGLPKMRPTAQQMSRMQNGSFMHLRWQMEGLSEGWLPEAEVPVRSDEYGLRGTMDGIAYEGSIVELKSTNSNGYRRISTFGPMVPHLFQMATYMLCTGKDKGIFLYENKDNQEYVEIPVTRDEVPVVAAAETAASLHLAIRDRTLVEPLNDCLDRTGWQYDYCDYRDKCLGIHQWKEGA